MDESLKIEAYLTEIELTVLLESKLYSLAQDWGARNLTKDSLVHGLQRLAQLADHLPNEEPHK